MTDAYRICGLIPCYENYQTVRKVAEALRAETEAVFIVDDGSGPKTREVLEALVEEGFFVVTRAQNGGKGAAVKTGFEAVANAGYTHAFQVDADAQHDLTRIPAFAEESRRRPEALILGHPIFDESAPLSRRIGRKITQFWTHIETLKPTIVDPMCGFRVYPVAPALAANAVGDHMDFDIEIAVKMVRLGVPVENMEVGVRYLDPESGGISHFRMFADNLAISWAHTRLVFSLFGWLLDRSRTRRLS